MFKAISPLDGRYAEKLDPLRDYFSEFALMRMRVIMEIRFIKAMDEICCFKPLTADEIYRLDKIETTFDESNYLEIKEIEKTTNHDVKSCEIYLQRYAGLNEVNRIHFGLTSEDVNNLAYTFLLKDYRDKIQLPQLKELLLLLCRQCEKWAETPFPARTHGQIASPTTFGKEAAVFLSRLFRQYKFLEEFVFRGKLNGATGNYSAFMAACPLADWPEFARKFMENNNLLLNPVTTQIEDHDTWAEFFDGTRRINQIVLDLNRDMWLYLMGGYLTLASLKDEVGSSTMPHKVNPINFENSEGNLKLSNALLSALSEHLTNSRLQRDLSDSTVARNMGTAFGHAYLALSETLKGLGKISVNESYCLQQISGCPELLAEPIQTILRKAGHPDPYGFMKDLTRGRRITLKDIHDALDTLNLESELLNDLKSLRPEKYIGFASTLAFNTAREIKQYLTEQE